MGLISSPSASLAQHGNADSLFVAKALLERQQSTGRSGGEKVAAAAAVEEIISIINGDDSSPPTDVSATNFVETYGAEHGGCQLFEFAQREFASGRPWGKPLYEWTNEDVALFKKVGLKCIADDPRNDVEQRRVSEQAFEYQFESLEFEAEAARQERAKAEEQDTEPSVAEESADEFKDSEEQLAADMRHFIDTQSTLSNESAISQSDALLTRQSAIGGGSAALFWEVEPQVRQIREERRAAEETAQAERSAVPIAQQLRQWLQTYKSMPAANALAAANQLLAKADSLAGASYTSEIWDLTSEVMDARWTLEETVKRTAEQEATHPACYNALAAIGQDHDWSQYPVWFDDPDLNLGDFLCWFLRTRALEGISLGANSADIAVDGISLHFEAQKHVESDDFYAAPNAKTDGQVKLAITSVSTNGQAERLTTFTQHIQVLTALVTYHGAPFVE